VSPDHECVIYVTEPDFWFFYVFLEDFFLKVSIKMLAITRKMEDPRSLFIELVVVREVCDC